jgi:hypothetical protein
MPSINPRIAVDLDPKNRPGVPMEYEPHPAPGAHERIPQQESPGIKVFRHGRPKSMTRVFGTAQPPSGLSGRIRAFAFKYPDHKKLHWLSLFFADRVDVVETHGFKLVPLGLAAAGGFLLSRGWRRGGPKTSVARKRAQPQIRRGAHPELA